MDPFGGYIVSLLLSEETDHVYHEYFNSFLKNIFRLLFFTLYWLGVIIIPFSKKKQMKEVVQWIYALALNSNWSEAQ